MVCQFDTRYHHLEENRQFQNVRTMRILCFLGFCSMMSPGLLGQGNKKGLTLVNQWSMLDWAYSTPEDRQHDIDNGIFVLGNGVPIDVDIHYAGNGNSRVFVTVPRFQVGIPGTLNTVTKTVTNGNPLLAPYPAWSWHQNSASCNTDRIVSVFRIQIDECNRLWVLDSGKIGSDQLCLPQILAFDLSTNTLVHRYEIPRTQFESTSIFVTPVVDIRGPKGSGCDDAFIYAADVSGFGLVVYDVHRGVSWRITNKLMFPVPDYGTFTINNESFDLMDGILGMALSPYREGHDRTLFFHALASATENYVSTSVIRNQTLFEGDNEASPRSFRVYYRKRPSQSAAEAMDKNGIMYFGLLRETSMACWNSATEYDQRNIDILERNPTTLQFPSGVKMVNNMKGGQELWVLTCRFQKVMTGTLDQVNDINFRIQAVKVEDFLAGSKCGNRPPGHFGGGGGYGLHQQPGPAWDVPTYGRNGTPKREIPDTDGIVFNN